MERVVTDLSSEGWGEGSDGWSLQRKGNFTELLEARALGQPDLPCEYPHWGGTDCLILMDREVPIANQE